MAGFIRASCPHFLFGVVVGVYADLFPLGVRPPEFFCSLYRVVGVVGVFIFKTGLDGGPFFCRFIL